MYNDSDNSVYTINPPLPNTYWEAWQVVNGVVQFGGMDIYQTDSFSDSTHGQYNITGVVDFYENSVVGGNSPSSWGNISEAGNLNATFNMPSWWSGMGYTHSLSMSWE